MMHWVVLASDALLFLFLCVAAVLGWQQGRNSLSRQRWRKVFVRRSSCIAFLVLLVYFSLALLDSVHFRDDRGEVSSALDQLLTPWLTMSETTYSAPLADHLFSQSFMVQDGLRVRAYPPLSSGSESRSMAPWPQRLAMAWCAVAVFVGLIWFWMRRYASVYLTTAWRQSLYWIGGGLLLLMVSMWALSGAYHPLGTDKVGEDVWYQGIKSIRTGVLLGVLTLSIMLPFAVVFGLLAGFFRGWVDDVIQYIYTTLSSIPGVLLIAAMVLSLQLLMSLHPDWFPGQAERADARLLFLCVILGVTGWTGLCRLLRGETMKLRAMGYVEAAMGMGVSRLRILQRHILPNVMPLVMITLALDFSGLVLAEAVLSYVGIGVDPTMYSWGNMINASRMEMARDPVVWWPLLTAFGFMLLLVLSANIFADAVRDAFDPHTVVRT